MAPFCSATNPCLSLCLSVALCLCPQGVGAHEQREAAMGCEAALKPVNRDMPETPRTQGLLPVPADRGLALLVHSYSDGGDGGCFNK